MNESKKLDYRATKKRIENLFEKYEKCLMRIDKKHHPILTDDYMLKIPSLLSCNIHAMGDSQTHYDYMTSVIECVNQLPSPYREITILTYIEDKTIIEMAEIIMMSQRTTSTRKKRALELFAHGMGVEVYIKEGH